MNKGDILKIHDLIRNPPKDKGLALAALARAVPGLLEHIEDQDRDLGVAGRMIYHARNNSPSEYESECTTCKEPYTKELTRRANICSNSFHCCRDCVWVMGKRIFICKDHKIPVDRLHALTQTFAKE